MNNSYLTFNSKNELTHITYFFVNNQKSTVDVSNESDELKNELITLHRENETLSRYQRHLNCVPIDDFHYVECNNPLFDCYDKPQHVATHEYFETALKKLTPQQYELLYEIYFLKTPATEIAKRENVSKAAISNRLGRAHTALERHLLRHDLFRDRYSDFDAAA